MIQPIDLDEARQKLSACTDAPDYAAWAAYRGANLLAELESLRKLLGTVRTYCDAPAMVKGEAFRDMAETLRWIGGERDDLCGWPACYEREQRKLEAARAEIAAYRHELERLQPIVCPEDFDLIEQVLTGSACRSGE